jgi:hypothetical protein
MHTLKSHRNHMKQNVLIKNILKKYKIIEIK